MGIRRTEARRAQDTQQYTQGEFGRHAGRDGSVCRSTSNPKPSTLNGVPASTVTLESNGEWMLGDGNADVAVGDEGG